MCIYQIIIHIGSRPNFVKFRLQVQYQCVSGACRLEYDGIAGVIEKRTISLSAVYIPCVQIRNHSERSSYTRTRIKQIIHIAPHPNVVEFR